MTPRSGRRALAGGDALAMAIEALRTHRTRTGLTVTGIAVGVLAVLVLTSLGEAARRYVTREFAAIGANLVIVAPGRTETTGAIPGGPTGTTRPLTLEDARAIARRVPGVQSVAPVVEGSADAAHGGRTRAVLVVGTTEAFASTRRLRVAAGRFLPPGDARSGAFVVVLGRNVARALFERGDPLGAPVRLGGWRFRVVGVVETRGASPIVDLDDAVYVPVAAAQRMFDRDGLSGAWVRLDDPAVPPATLERIRRALRERHDGEEDFSLVTQGSMLRSFESVIDALTAALAGIAAISLAVAGIGIMNVMLVSVSERTAEVGLYKAVGAQRRQVLGLFLLEAMLLSAAGIVAGVAVALALTGLARLVWPDVPVQPEPMWMAITAAVALAAGASFGLAPARRASRLAPVDALRKPR